MAGSFKELGRKAESLIEIGNETDQEVQDCQQSVASAVSRVAAARNQLAAASETDEDGNPVGDIDNARAMLSMAENDLAASQRALENANERAANIGKQKSSHAETIAAHNQIERSNLDKLRQLQSEVFGQNSAALAEGIAQRVNEAEDIRARLLRSMGIDEIPDHVSAGTGAGDTGWNGGGFSSLDIHGQEQSYHGGGTESDGFAQDGEYAASIGGGLGALGDPFTGDMYGTGESDELGNTHTNLLDDLNSLPKNLSEYPGSEIGNVRVIDENLSPERAVIRDLSTGNDYTVYPNPMGRMSHMEGQQGNNIYGMHNDCGLASGSKGVNDFMGQMRTNENGGVVCAVNNHLCNMSRAVKNPDGTINYSECGGTVEDDVKAFYKAYGIDSTAYTGMNVPSLDDIADSLRDGSVVSMAVSSDLMWHYDEAQYFDESMIDRDRYLVDSNYKSVVDSLCKMHDGVGVFRADHFVNVSNAVYDSSGNLTHFIVSDTGNGTTKMIPRGYLERAYIGTGGILVGANGCVVTEGRRHI